MISVVSDSAWQPSPPSPQLAQTRIKGRRWQGYLQGQGYTNDEAQAVLAGWANDPDQPGLGPHVAQGIDQRAADDRGTTAVQGLVVGYLELRPPLAVLDLPLAPPQYLSPQQFGRRLVTAGERHDLGGQIYNDRITSLAWWIVRPSREQGAAMITGGALFTLLGLAAPQWRLVKVLGRRSLATRRLSNWHRMNGDSDEAITRSRAADLWLLFSGNSNRHRRRLNPIPGFPEVCRYDLRAVMGYDGASRRDKAWGMKVAGLDKLTIADAPMLRRIVGLADGKIRRAVQIGGLSAEASAELYATLVGRREAMRSTLQRLTGG